MNLSEKIQKIKSYTNRIKPIENDIILVAVILFVALISFGLGRLSAVSERKTPITVRQSSPQAVEKLTSNVITSKSDFDGEKLYMASKNGAKYHYPWCSGAQSIKEENKIWFATKEEAEKAGYGPASNCKGL